MMSPKMNSWTRFCRALLMLSLLVFQSACKKSESKVPDCPHDVGLLTSDQWLSQAKLPYEALPEKRSRIREKYDSVRVGSTKSEVIQAFGNPDFEEELGPKEPNRPCKGYVFVYYFEKPEEMNNEARDKRLDVFFNVQGTVTWIASNVGLPEKGGPSTR